MFSRNRSKESSRASSTERREDERGNFESHVEPEVESVADKSMDSFEEALNSLHLDPYTERCQKLLHKDSLWRHIQAIGQDIAQICATKNIDMKTDLNALSIDFANKQLEDKLALDILKSEVKEANKPIIESRTVKEMKISPPTDFSHNTVLTRQHSLELAARIYPGMSNNRNAKFSGVRNEGSLNVIEFLRNMNRAFSFMKLSEQEFKNQLLAASTGSAHDRISEWFSLNHTLNEVYCLLISYYDRSLPPHVAEQKLKKLRATKNMNIYDLQNQVLHLATVASESVPRANRQSLFDYWGTSTLLGALPEESRRLVTHEFRQMGERDGVQPSYLKLIRLIEPHSAEINSDLRKYGADDQFSKPNYRVNNTNVKRRVKKKVRGPQVNELSRPTISTEPPTNVEQIRGRSRQPNNRQVNQNRGRSNSKVRFNNNSNMQRQRSNNRSFSRTRKPFVKNNSNFSNNSFGNNSYRNNGKRGFENRKEPKGSFCSNCGSSFHVAADNCKEMMTDQGVRVENVAPHFSTCKLCPSSIYKRLNHPEKFCIFRTEVSKFISPKLLKWNLRQ